MSEAIMEKPQLEEPQEPEKSESPDISDLIATLEKAGVQSQEQLENKLRASQESGRLANLLGGANKRIEELEKSIQQLTTQQKAKANDDYWDEPASKIPIDMEDLVSRAVEKTLSKREKQQAAVQQAAWAAYNRIHQDRDFHLVADKWGELERDPQFAMKLSQGQVDPVNAYQELLRSHYKEVVSKAAETIRNLTGGQKPPDVHVESQARMPSGKTPESDEMSKKIKDFKERVEKGGKLTEEDEMLALQAVLMGK